jgi:autophagy-related protein 2
LQAINSVLSGLPIQLQDGSIASVTARIPWPNPLTSALGLSIQSAHLTFHLNPITSKAPSAPGPHLADSVVSVAESFVHDELSPREEAALRDSFHPDLAASTDDAQSVPGGLDPFLSNPDDEEFQVDGDPAGVSIFAALIERLLARFEFDASDTRITLAHPGQASLTLTVQQILYGTERRPVPDNEGPDEVATAVEAGDGETRTVSISGVDVTCFDLHPHLPSSPSTLSPVSPVLSTHLRRPPSRPISPASSSSSLDEGTQFLMTQSIVSLPPRSPSPTSSVDASMYQSALSTLIPPDAAGDRYQSELRSQSRTPSPGSGSTPLDTPRVQTLDLTPCTERRGPEPETILSFGTEPITIRLTTPASDIASPPPSSPSLTAPRLRLEHKARDKLNLSVTSGTIACALRGSHVRTIWEMANCWGSYSSQSSPAHERHATSSSADDSTSVLDLGIETTIRVRGIVMLLLPRSDPSVSSEDLLRRLFFSNPLVPPRSPQGYVRLYLEALNAEVLFDPSIQATPTGPSKTPMRPGKGAGSVIGASFTLSLSLHELSIFTHHIVMRPGSADGTELVASPLLITDHHLPFQYPPAHAHPSATQASASKSDTHGIHSGLPSFDLVDWTDDARRTSSARVSLWRTKLRSQSSRQQASSSSSANSSALSLKATRTMAASSRTARQKPHRSSVDAIEADIVPLHIFVDLDTSFCSDGLLAFVEDAVPPGLHPGESTTQHGVDDDVEEGNASEEGEPSLATPRTSSMADKERERRRLEKLVLDDLNLDLDYRSPEPEPAPARKPHKRKVRQYFDLACINADWANAGSIKEAGGAVRFASNNTHGATPDQVCITSLHASAFWCTGPRSSWRTDLKRLSDQRKTEHQV